MIINKNYDVQKLFEILEKNYKLKEVALQELYKYFSEYSKDSSLKEITEGYIQNDEDSKIYIKDASSENGFLPDEQKKYDLYILSYKNKKLISSFYREEFGGNIELIRLIESFKGK